MKTRHKRDESSKQELWEEKSGLLKFLSSVNGAVSTFNEDFEFGISSLVTPPTDIDGDREITRRTGFTLIRANPLLPEKIYCLYSILSDRVLYGFVGIYRDGSIKTFKELRPIKDFTKGKVILYEWLKHLVRASCDKPAL